MTNTADQTMPNLNDYRTSINQLSFSDSAKERIAARLAEAAAAEGQPAKTSAPVVPFRARKRRLSAAAVAAGLALALGAGGIAYATGGFVSLERFVGDLFGGAPAQTEVVDKVGRPVNASATSNGVTVTADAIVGDKKNVAVIFSIAKDDGTPFEGLSTLDNGCIEAGFEENLHIELPLFSAYGAYGSSYLYDADPADNSIQLVETRTYATDDNSEISLIGRTATMNLSNLRAYDAEGMGTVIAEGDWELRFDLDYEDSSVALPAGQTFDLGGLDAIIDELSISPVALNIAYTATSETTWTEQESGKMSDENSDLMNRILTLDVALNMADGTTVEVFDEGGGHVDWDSYDEDGNQAHCEKGIFFDRILDLSEVESVNIGGTTIEL